MRISTAPAQRLERLADRGELHAVVRRAVRAAGDLADCPCLLDQRLDARPDLRLVAGGGFDDLEGDGLGADRRDPEQLHLGAEGDEVAGPGHAPDRLQAELGPAGLDRVDRREPGRPPRSFLCQGGISPKG